MRMDKLTTKFQEALGDAQSLALAKDLARALGGDLQLVIPPQAVDPELPALGNAFVLSLPASAAAGK